MELGHLDADAVDRILSAMIDLVDREIEGGARLARARQVTAGIEQLSRALESCSSDEKAGGSAPRP